MLVRVIINILSHLKHILLHAIEGGLKEETGGNLPMFYPLLSLMCLPFPCRQLTRHHSEQGDSYSIYESMCWNFSCESVTPNLLSHKVIFANMSGLSHKSINTINACSWCMCLCCLCLCKWIWNTGPKYFPIFHLRLLPFCFGKNSLLFSILAHVLRVQLNQGVFPKAETQSTR